MIILNVAAVSLYLIATIYQAICLLKRNDSTPNRPLLLGLGSVAVGLHGISAITTMYDGQLLDLGFLRVASLMFWLITTISLLSLLRRPTSLLITFLFPLAALSIIGSTLSAPIREVKMSMSPGIFTHILSSMLAYSVLTIAAIQALIVALLVKQLKHHNTRGILNAMPPLQTMEQLLFEMIWIGIALLTLSLTTGALFVDDLFAQHLVHKTALTVGAWIIFAILLWGRHQLGWRSLTAVRWTLWGFGLLMIGYFGSKFVLEFLLNK